MPVYQFIRPVLFWFPPERIHHLTMGLLTAVLKIPPIASWIRNRYRISHSRLEKTVFGIVFPNPVGLAAGFDKNGTYIREMEALGFGFTEIGTVTPRPQPGNPLPRLFRLPADHGLINRMGFNNEGVAAMAERLRNLPKERNIIVGGNIGKNKDTPNDQAHLDYAACFEALYPYVDYFVVNVSSPNTPGLRELQEKEPLLQLLQHLKQLNHRQPSPKPLLLKIAPDLTDSQLDDILEIAKTTALDGIIATNTTIHRDGLKTTADTLETIGQGGMSGAPLRHRATEVIRYLHQKSGGNLTILGVGGIESPEDALEKLAAGATLVQIYTGLVYRGPGLSRDINTALLQSYDPAKQT